MRILNLGILAHVDAGKTSLTERLLFTAGVIDHVGRVDHGDTQTDSLALERQRGITIKAAVVSFVVGDVTINLIDTPGHPDFIAEVERTLAVLDGAVLVVSAVEGVQAQTRTLMRTLRRLKTPTIVFVNKIDRRGARYAELLAELDSLGCTKVVMGHPSALGARHAAFVPCSPGHLAETLSEHDDRLLADFVTNPQSLTADRLSQALRGQTHAALVHPVYFGSAMTSAGVDALLAAVTDLLPATEPDVSSAGSGLVFKIERGPNGERIATVRMFAGTLRVRDRVPDGPGRHSRVTAIRVFQAGSTVLADQLAAGEIGRVWGLANVRIGDAIGATPERTLGRQFPRPSLETTVRAVRSSDRGRLYPALSQLAEQDPLINLRQNEAGDETAVSLYGEVQKEVIAHTLATDYGIGVTFGETTTVCVERVVGVGEALEIIDVAPNPFLATVGLRVEPAGSGITFRLGVELGSMPRAFFTAVEETVHSHLQHGIHGWQVTDCVVTMTHSGYWARQSHMGGGFDKSMSSTAGDFRNLTRLVLTDALRQAGTQVCEPVHRFRLEIPADTVGAVAIALARAGGVADSADTHGDRTVLAGELPAAALHGLQQALPALTRGEGLLEHEFELYRAVRGRAGH